MNKLFIIFAILLVLFSAGNSMALPFIQTSSTGLTISVSIPTAIPQNQSRDFYIHVLNITNNLQSKATCYLHIYDEQRSGEHIFTNISSSFNNFDIEFTPNAANFTNKGFYSYKAICNTTGQAGIYESGFYVTKNGNDPADEWLMSLIYLLFIFTLVGLFYTLFITLFKLATISESVYDVMMAWGFVLLLIVVIHLAESYLINSFVEDLSNQLLTYTSYTNTILPLLALLITILIKSTQKKRMISAQEMGGMR